MTTEKVSIGIIGVGQIGKKHLETYLSLPDVQVAAICGRDPQKTEAVAREYNLPFWTTDYRALLERQNISAVSVCLHNNLHMPISVAALEAGKHVLCEKPIAGSYADGKTMLEAAQRSKRLLAIQLSDLFSLETRAAKEAIQNGWLGTPYLAHSAGFRRRGRPFVDGYGTPAFVQKESAGGGALYDLGVYHIANILYLLGNPMPMRISGKLYQQTGMDEARRAESHFNVEEVALGTVALENNITLTFIETWAMHLDNLEGSYITGSEGGVRLNPFGLYKSFGNLDLNANADLAAFEFRQNTVGQMAGLYEGPIQHFVAAVQNKVEPIPTAEIALNTMHILEGSALSDQFSREVSADEVIERSKSTSQTL
jgi:predicted dehydrogenase